MLITYHFPCIFSSSFLTILNRFFTIPIIDKKVKYPKVKIEKIQPKVPGIHKPESAYDKPTEPATNTA